MVVMWGGGGGFPRGDVGGGEFPGGDVGVGGCS